MDEKKIEKIVDKCLDRKLKSYNAIVEEKSTYKKVEDILRKYDRFKKRIIYLENNLENIILKKNSTISGLGGHSFEYKSDLEKKEDIREQNKKLIARYQEIIDLANQGLEEIKKDKYYKIIELRYFEKDMIENISEKLNVSERSVKRHRNRLISELCTILFPEETLENIF